VRGSLFGYSRELGGSERGRPEESVTVDAETRVWPAAKLSALRLGRRLVAEVPAAPGRRAFVGITPISDQRDHVAAQQGWVRPDSQRSFKLEQWDYDQQQIGGWDYDIGAQLVRADTADSESSLLALLAEWGLTPAQLNYPWDTDDPR
jgi:hypothetical protein